MTLIRQLSTAAADFDTEFERLRHWSAETDAAIEGRVAEILADVRQRGELRLEIRRARGEPPERDHRTAFVSRASSGWSAARLSL